MNRYTQISGRYKQLIRCLRMARDRAWLDVHDEGGLQRLAQRHGVSTRTIRRDLQALREAGYGEIPWFEQDIPADRIGDSRRR